MKIKEKNIKNGNQTIYPLMKIEPRKDWNWIPSRPSPHILHPLHVLFFQYVEAKQRTKHERGVSRGLD